MVGGPGEPVAGFRERFRRLFETPSPVRPGIYHYRREAGGRMMRLHLRVEADGAGLLLVNASGVLHLNATAVLLIKLFLDGHSRDDAVSTACDHYLAYRADVERDFDKICKLIAHMEAAEDACPVASLEVPSVPPFGRKVSAPYRADLALTYECNNRCLHCYVARGPGEKTPLAFGEWKQVLDRLWAVGVPHVCFTGGEATLSPHLVGLIEYAEDLGMVSGLLTNGLALADREYPRRLVGAGLDHVQITIESHREAVHDQMVGSPGAFRETLKGIANALAEDLFLVTNTTLCKLNLADADRIVEFLAGLGVRTFAMNSLIATGRAPESGLGIAEPELEPVLGLVNAVARHLKMRFIWYTPTHYCKLNPTTHGLGYKRCTAGEYNICIEPDGAVIPCQSYYQPAGHILRDEWGAIWNSPLFTAIRERSSVPESCRGCPDFEVCGSGCPLSSGDRFLCTDSTSEG